MVRVGGALRSVRGVMVGALFVSAVLGACSDARPATAAPSKTAERAALETYLRQVEPLRLGVNRLLDGADPILDADHSGRITPERAEALMDRLERRFAGYTVAINAIVPAEPALAAIQRPYAYTYVQEDAYLSALAAALPEGEFDDLPDTQSEQRAAIIQWRTRLTIIAHELGVHLPGDLQAAGRGEIAPALSGS